MLESSLLSMPVMVHGPSNPMIQVTVAPFLALKLLGCEMLTAGGVSSRTISACATALSLPTASRNLIYTVCVPSSSDAKDQPLRFSPNASHAAPSKSAALLISISFGVIAPAPFPLPGLGSVAAMSLMSISVLDVSPLSPAVDARENPALCGAVRSIMTTSVCSGPILPTSSIVLA